MGPPRSTHIFGNSKFRDLEPRWAGEDPGPGDQQTKTQNHLCCFMAGGPGARY